MKEILDFLTRLAANNNKEWFSEHKKEYQHLRAVFESMIADLIYQIQQFDPELGDVDVKKTLFRIYRDVRFSKDKSPYKLNFGAAIAKGGKKMGYSGYYIHLQPGRSFIGGGLYMPPSPILKKIRNEIYYNTSQYLEIINQPDFVEEFGRVEGEKLVRPPKDFPADFDHIELLKLKSYVVIKSFRDDALLKSDFIPRVMQAYKAMVAFNAFLNKALDA